VLFVAGVDAFGGIPTIKKAVGFFYCGVLSAEFLEVGAEVA